MNLNHFEIPNPFSFCHVLCLLGPKDLDQRIRLKTDKEMDTRNNSVPRHDSQAFQMSFC